MLIAAGSRQAGYGNSESKWRLNSTSRHTGPHAVQAAGALLPGFISYGTSILLYVYSQRILGAARTATYYASAPFIGAGISFFVFRQPPTCLFVLALALMGAWAAVALCESQSHRHKHAPIEHDHRHAHLHQKNT